MQFPKIKKNNILLALVVSIITLIICVFAVDFYYIKEKRKYWVCEVCQFNSELGWDNIPNTKTTNGKITYTTNSLGFRSGEVDQTKEHILVLGDSVAFGVGVNDNETVSHYIQRKVPQYQILNLSVSGYSIDQYYLKLKKEIKHTNPKYIIPIIFSGNDWVETNQNNMFEISKPFFKVENGNLVRENPKLSPFSCWNYFRRNWFFNKFNLNTLKHHICTFQKHNEFEGKKLISMLLDRIYDVGNSIGAKTIFVLSPTLFDFYEETCSAGSLGSFCAANQLFFKKFLKNFYLNYKNSNQNAPNDFLKNKIFGHRFNYLILSEILNKKKYKTIDLYDYFKNKSFNMGLIYNKNDNFHYSPFGNSLLAEIIVAKLKLS